MPIFLARWPDFTISIVEAKNKSELFWRLEEIAEPKCVNYKKLQTPLSLTLKSSIDIEKNKNAPKNSTVNTLLESMKNFMLDTEFCDMTVCIGDSEIKCHKAVLARNEYFRAMLKSKFKETREGCMHLSDVKIEVFKVVLEYLYTCVLDLNQKSVYFLYSLLKYCHMIGLNGVIADIVERIKSHLGYINNEEKAKELLEGIRLSAVLNLNDLNDFLTKEIMNRMQQEYEMKAIKKNNVNFNLFDLVKNNNAELAEKFENDVKVKISSDTFLDIVKNIQSPTYLLDIKEAAEKIEQQGMVTSMEGSPYCTIVEEVRKEEKNISLVEKCCKAIHVLSELGFPVDKESQSRERVESLVPRPSYMCNPFKTIKGSALYYSAYHGVLPLAKTLLEVGASPLHEVNKSGRTIMHVIDREIRDAMGPPGILSDERNFPGGLFGGMAVLRQEKPKSSSDIEKMKNVLKIMLQSAGFKDISEVPYIPKDNNVDPEYIKKLLSQFEGEDIYPDISFKVEDPEGSAACDSSREFICMLHPRVCDLTVDEYVEEDDEEAGYIKYRRTVDELVKTAAFEDLQDAKRCLHPDKKSKSFHG